MTQINLIDLFAGCGGLTEGFVSSKSYNTLAVVEWEKYPLDTLKTRLLNKWGYSDEEIFIHYDIQDTKGLLDGTKKEGFESKVGLKKLLGGISVDLIVGGPPCQAYSLAGRAQDKFGMKKDYRNYLFESFARLVQIYSPNFFVFENVPGILSAKPGDILITDRIRTVFDSIGYEISTDLRNEALIDISYYGVPQIRKRVIIFGTKKNNRNKIPKFYEALHNKKIENQEILKSHLQGMTKFKPKRANKSMVTYEPIGKNSFSNNIPRTHSLRDTNIFEVLAKDIETGNFKYSTTQSKKELYFEKTEENLIFINTMFLNMTNPPIQSLHTYIKMDSVTFTLIQHKRSITPREAARIQSFPDDFVFTGPMTANYKMIGNAVPPKFSKSIADSLLEVL